MQQRCHLGAERDLFSTVPYPDISQRRRAQQLWRAFDTPKAMLGVDQIPIPLAKGWQPQRGVL